MKKLKFILLCLLLVLALTVTAGCGSKDDDDDDDRKSSKDDRDDDDKDDNDSGFGGFGGFGDNGFGAMDLANLDFENMNREDLLDLGMEQSEIDELSDEEFEQFKVSMAALYEANKNGELDDLDSLEDLGNLNGMDNNDNNYSTIFAFEDYTNAYYKAYEAFEDELDKNHSDDFMSYYNMTMGLNMANLEIVTVNFNYMMEAVAGPFNDSVYEWPNGAGETISSYQENGPVHTITIKDTYNENPNTKEALVTYNKAKETFDYYQRFTDAENYQNAVTYVQFATDGDGGYYTQMLTIHLDNPMEELIVFHFNGKMMNVYRSTKDSADENSTLPVDITKNIPSNLIDLMGDFPDPTYILYDGNKAEIKGEDMGF